MYVTTGTYYAAPWNPDISTSAGRHRVVRADLGRYTANLIYVVTNVPAPLVTKQGDPASDVDDRSISPAPIPVRWRPRIRRQLHHASPSSDTVRSRFPAISTSPNSNRRRPDRLHVQRRRHTVRPALSRPAAADRQACIGSPTATYVLSAAVLNTARRVRDQGDLPGIEGTFWRRTAVPVAAKPRPSRRCSCIAFACNSSFVQ